MRAQPKTNSVRKSASQIPFGLGAAKWESHLGDLMELHRKHGHFNVPVKYAKNPSLCTWTNWNRVKMRHGKLLPYRQQRLEQIGFSCAYRSPQGNGPWMKMFSQLVEYHRTHGHFNIPRKGSSVDLYNWVAAQRLAHDSDRLQPDRQQRLERLGFKWDQPSVWFDQFWNCQPG